MLQLLQRIYKYNMIYYGYITTMCTAQVVTLTEKSTFFQAFFKQRHVPGHRRFKMNLNTALCARKFLTKSGPATIEFEKTRDTIILFFVVA